MEIEFLANNSPRQVKNSECFNIDQKEDNSSNSSQNTQSTQPTQNNNTKSDETLFELLDGILRNPLFSGSIAVLGIAFGALLIIFGKRSSKKNNN